MNSRNDSDYRLWTETKKKEIEAAKGDPAELERIARKAVRYVEKIQTMYGFEIRSLGG